MPSDDRLHRIREVLDLRLGWVRCAIEPLHQRHNVSAMLRTCDAFGLHHVHLLQTGSFRASPGAARGAERWLELHRHETVEEAFEALRAAGFAVWVADLSDPPVPPEEVPLASPVCLWFGTELQGVSQAARALADGVVTVPMRGFAQSLNVSVAAALALRPVAERARALHGREALLPDEEREATWARWRAREEKVEAGVRARAGLRHEG